MCTYMLGAFDLRDPFHAAGFYLVMRATRSLAEGYKEEIIQRGLRDATRNSWAALVPEPTP